MSLPLIILEYALNQTLHFEIMQYITGQFSART